VKLLFATSEAIPFAKTGGLADVCGTLPSELALLGHEVVVMLPAHRSVSKAGLPIEPTDFEFTVPIGAKRVPGRLLKSHLPNGQVPVYLVDQPEYFDRHELYTSGGVDHADNCERFVFFCRAVLEAVRLIPLATDVIHCHDWQTGLIPAYLKTEFAGIPPFDGISSVLTIHNLAYQGQFWHWDMLLTGLDWKYFNWHQMEFFGKLNLLKTGMVFADWLTTVSHRYAAEIQQPDQGCGLHGVLASRRNSLTGIINGADYSAWDPAVDRHLPTHYTPATVRSGKAACKAALQRELGLSESPHLPLAGFIGRLTEQKGLDLLLSLVTDWTGVRDVQWVILGTGEPKYHEALARLAARHAGRLAVRLSFDEGLAHRIEAGCDLFLMPSRFEPCGLNQLFSLKYGTLPLVRATGGLVDTVTPLSDRTRAQGSATGFSFVESQPAALARCVEEALSVFANEAEMWHQMQMTGMHQDWSWAKSAREYSRLYSSVLAARGQVALA
jgi:starch synthase